MRARYPIGIALSATAAVALADHSPTAADHSSTPQPPAATHAARHASTTARPGAEAAATEVLKRFVATYGTYSVADVAQHLLALQRLATETLATRLRSAAASAREQAVRSMPPGARTASAIATIQLAPNGANTLSGTVTLNQSLVTSTGGRGQPVSVQYTATLRDTPLGWRVSAFTAQP